MTPGTPIWRLVLPFTVIGVGMAFVWSPLTATATRNLPPQLAGAGSAVYNAIRQLGAVLGSAGMAAFMTSRISAEMPRGATGDAGRRAVAVRLPEFVREPFSAAMSQSVLLPAFIALFGVVAALFLVDFKRARPPEDDDVDWDYGEDYDDDPYVEYILLREPGIEEQGNIAPRVQSSVRRQHDVPVQPIGFAHNGSHIDGERQARPVDGLLRVEDEAQRSRRRRPDPDEPASRGS